VGTGTVRDRMLDPFTLEGRPRPVTRAQHAWQVYDPARKEKGGVRWHTVEGPSVLKRRGLYYEMFSGGNWKNVTYGVSYATARSLEDSGEWTQHADGARLLPVLRTVPGRVLGPGHNSVVLGPDQRQLFCVYHRWSRPSGERVLCIDRLGWAGTRLLVLGPSDGPVEAPLKATRLLRPVKGEVLPLPAPACLLHWTASPPLRVELGAGSQSVWTCRLDGELRVQDDVRPRAAAGPADLRLELSGRHLRLELHGEGMRWEGELAATPETLLFLEGGGRAAVTLGFEDVFGEGGRSPSLLGWREASGRWSLGAEGLACEGQGEILRETGVVPAEVVVSARAQAGGGYGLRLGDGLWLRISAEGTGYRLDGPGLGRPLPRAFAGEDFQQLRLHLDALSTRVFWERTFLGTLPALDSPQPITLLGHGGAIFDAARVTARPEEQA
jgi:hypothetical protein